MQLNFKELQYIVGDTEIINKMAEVKPLKPFADCVVEFLDALSKDLLKNRIGGFSDVATFAFWCRKGTILKEKSKYDDLNKRLGKGIILHSTPSNVPVNFAFSFVAGLLAGNANIVRLPKKDFEQVKIICDAVNKLLSDRFAELAPYICMVKYPPIKDITDAFSALCACRVVWGGDNTVAEMRQSPLGARAMEITFADRYSLAAINADRYLDAEDKDNIVNNFYNDTYFSDQNACTAPHTLIWLGEKKEEAKADFWDRLHKLVKNKYQMAPVQAVGKLTAFYKAAVVQDGLKLESSNDNYIFRMKVKSLDKSLQQCRYNSGFFMEYDAGSLLDILPLCTMRCQTLSYYGIKKEEIQDFIDDGAPKGIDRFVPMGKSMDFTLIWDGYDLIRSMSRIINVV